MKDTKNELEKELTLWRNLREYVNKNLKGKTLTKDIEKEIEYMIKEREAYLKNILSKNIKLKNDP